MRPTGPRNARPLKRTGANSISSFRGKRMLKRFIVGAFAVVAAVGFIAAAPPKLTGGNGTLYIGGWPKKIFAIDEATEKVTGTIDVTTGAPTRMVLSKDRKRFYLVNAVGEERSE